MVIAVCFRGHLVRAVHSALHLQFSKNRRQPGWAATRSLCAFPKRMSTLYGKKSDLSYNTPFRDRDAMPDVVGVDHRHNRNSRTGLPHEIAHRRRQRCVTIKLFHPVLSSNRLCVLPDDLNHGIPRTASGTILSVDRPEQLLHTPNSTAQSGSKATQRSPRALLHSKHARARFMRS